MISNTSRLQRLPGALLATAVVVAGCVITAHIVSVLHPPEFTVVPAVGPAALGYVDAATVGSGTPVQIGSDRRVVAPAGERLRLIGWAACAMPSLHAANEIELIIDRSRVRADTQRVVRPDVERAYQSSQLHLSGFAIAISVPRAARAYEVTVEARCGRVRQHVDSPLTMIVP